MEFRAAQSLIWCGFLVCSACGANEPMAAGQPADVAALADSAPDPETVDIFYDLYDLHDGGLDTEWDPVEATETGGGDGDIGPLTDGSDTEFDDADEISSSDLDGPMDEISATDALDEQNDQEIDDSSNGKECATAGDCAGKLAVSPCETFECLVGKCQTKVVSDGTNCQLPSGKAGTCSFGSCMQITKPCSDGNVCTVDVFDSANGTCVFSPIPGCGIQKCKPTGECDDGNPCTIDKCAATTGACVSMPQPSNSPCDDGSKCTSADSCVGGVCVGKVVICTDGNPCTEDSCDPTTGNCTVTVLPNGATCSDSIECTASDACNSGKCVGTEMPCVSGDMCALGECDVVSGKCAFSKIPKCGTSCSTSSECDDGNVCTTETCSSSVCESTSTATSSCSDGNACTIDDVCSFGVCKGKATDCDDGQWCTADSCALLSGKCIHSDLSGIPCDDNLACTLQDVCQNGKCQGLTKKCQNYGFCLTSECESGSGACVAKFLAAPCSDYNPCTVGDNCTKGVCAGTPKDCDDANPCTLDTCTSTGACASAAIAGCGDLCSKDQDCTASGPCRSAVCEIGKCVSSPLPVGVTCSDGLSCTLGDLCNANGECVGKIDTCNDGNSCTVDWCSDSAGCTFFVGAVGTSCDDGDPCTLADACSSTVCVPGEPADCADGNPCTVDLCDVLNGKCANSWLGDGVPCLDADLCTYSESCSSGSCIGLATKCEDSDSCTIDVCSAADGTCVFVLIPNCGSPCAVNETCDDGNPCTTNTCVAGECVQAPDLSANCADGNSCTLQDHCQLLGGSAVCKGFPKNCEDGNLCTIEHCDFLTGLCFSNAVVGAKTCDDGDACTKIENCVNGSCKPAAFADCDDNNACTKDLCSPAAGGCWHSPILGCGKTCKSDPECYDFNPCTVDVCMAGHCAMVSADGAPCEDGNACTTDETCWKGVCVSENVLFCDDKNPCTLDTCDTGAGGCVTSALDGGSLCNDANPCTYNDTCSLGKCGGTPAQCEDGNPCTLDGCSNGGLCEHLELAGCGTKCSSDTDCASATPCTSGVCTIGVCAVTLANGGTCSDGDPCTLSDTCDSGHCRGSVMACDDGNICTLESCDPTVGKCVSGVAPLGILCNDGDACTTKEKCVAGLCKAAAQVGCDDGMPCTVDTCDSSTGKCTFAPMLGCGGPCTKTADCDDGNSCTIDGCIASTCVLSLSSAPCDDSDPCTYGDKCSAGACLSGSQSACFDNNPCTLDVCDKVSGECSYPNASNGSICDDKNPCSPFDLCTDGKCFGATPTTCDDGIPCTIDSCDAQTGKCKFEYDPPCGAPCTSDSDCSDNNPCTIDSCANGKCVIGWLNDAPCSDGNGCTNDDKCSSGACVPGWKTDCFDGIACTLDICNPSTGACELVLGPTCGKPCLVAGDCVDANPCTSEACENGNCVIGPSDGTFCDDFNGCTIGDHCKDGACQGGTPVCNDGNVCTIDTCISTALICLFLPIPNCTP